LTWYFKKDFFPTNIGEYGYFFYFHSVVGVVAILFLLVVLVVAYIDEQLVLAGVLGLETVKQCFHRIGCGSQY
jgi:hypothetical protein